MQKVKEVGGRQYSKERKKVKVDNLKRLEPLTRRTGQAGQPLLLPLMMPLSLLLSFSLWWWWWCFQGHWSSLRSRVKLIERCYRACCRRKLCLLRLPSLSSLSLCLSLFAWPHHHFLPCHSFLVRIFDCQMLVKCQWQCSRPARRSEQPLQTAHSRQCFSVPHKNA